MSQKRKIRRQNKLSKKQEERLAVKKAKDQESLATKISRITIIVLFATMVISLAYTVVALSGY